MRRPAFRALLLIFFASLSVGAWTAPANAQTKHKTNAKPTLGAEEKQRDAREKQIRVRLKEPARRRLFWEIVQVEDKRDLYSTQHEAKPSYPMSSTERERLDEHDRRVNREAAKIEDKAKERLARKWGLRTDDLVIISVEGGEKHWSMPQ